MVDSLVLHQGLFTAHCVVQPDCSELVSPGYGHQIEVSGGVECSSCDLQVQCLVSPRGCSCDQLDVRTCVRNGAVHVRAQPHLLLAATSMGPRFLVTPTSLQSINQNTWVKVEVTILAFY